MCISEGGKFELDVDIIDPSSISLTVERDGLATLSLVITSKDQKGLGCFSLPIGGATFKGIIESVNPTRLAGTSLIDNSIVAKGVVGAGGGGGGGQNAGV